MNVKTVPLTQSHKGIIMMASVMIPVMKPLTRSRHIIYYGVQLVERVVRSVCEGSCYLARNPHAPVDASIVLFRGGGKWTYRRNYEHQRKSTLWKH